MDDQQDLTLDLIATPVFQYTDAQFHALRLTSIIVSGIALSCAVTSMTTYIYMLIYEKKRANRVSLRCVMLSILAFIPNAIMNLIAVVVPQNSRFCRVWEILGSFLSVASAAFLGLVGLNLVLVFVIGVKQPERLEWFYYPGVLIYCMIPTVVGIEDVYKVLSTNQYNHQCWYYTNYIGRSYADLAWIVFYGFLFAIFLFSTIFSLVALVKVFRERQALVDKLTEMSTNAEDCGSVQRPTNQDINRHVHRHTNDFSKIVIRCIVYPFVPLLVNVWGFIIQMMIVTPDSVTPYWLLMLDTIFGWLEGVLVFMIFFSDPAVTSTLNHILRDLRLYFVDEYSHIEEYPDGRIKVTVSGLNPTTARARLRPRPKISHHVPPPAEQWPPDKDSTQSPPVDSSFQQEKSKSPTDDTFDQPRLRVVERTASQESKDDKEIPSNRMVIRRVSADAVKDSPNRYSTSPFDHVSSQITSRNGRQFEIRDITWTDENGIYVSYRHPRLVTVVHWILIHIFRVKRDETVEIFYPEGMARGPYCVMIQK
ncbi:uncharacterized protein BYT42DRAFT_610676 [Radiomyces spectabilis]|uniref:uncharacterized protein n=1 Tax=Radiomyces spectabilis TaxID=64574 RepID=UPI00221FE3CA|nr:uncharacterized protein BYT42DRAFT_610676 [Radiomyces spectabilis]KAI8391445.1 hypothetical protein BYT42DRAFT_610676 [Radiomyces spectabilis]